MPEYRVGVMYQKHGTSDEAGYVRGMLSPNRVRTLPSDKTPERERF